MKAANLMQAAVGLDQTVCHCFLPPEAALGGFLRARTLSQKRPLSEPICLLVFTCLAIATIGRALSSLIHLKHYKKTGGSFLNMFLARRGHPWSKKPGRY
jgi:hypothetical protein